MWSERVIVVATFGTLQQHPVTIAVLAGITSVVVVSRQRAIHSTAAARSWVAALPVSPGARRAEALILELTPIIAALTLISGFALLAWGVFAVAGLPAAACIVAWRALLVGTLLGAGVGLLVPSPKPVTPYPGSRYVPQRVTRGRHPEPSLAALGTWPVRRMFALLQPRTLSRALLPLLLMVPLGSTAATAMIWIGLFGVLAALVFLGMSVLWVTQAARLWLKPLPISMRRLGPVVALRAVLVMTALAATAAWLVWIGRS